MWRSKFQGHEDYIKADARMVIATTFSASRHMLDQSWIRDKYKAVDRSAAHWQGD